MKKNGLLQICSIGALFFLIILSSNNKTGVGVSSPDEIVKQAYEKALGIGEYNFTSTVEQTTTPLPMLVNTGRGTQLDTFYIEGVTNLTSNSMFLRLWQNGGNILSTDSSLEFKVENGIAYGKNAYTEEWLEVDNFSDVFAPGGNTLAFLVGAKNIQDINNEGKAYAGEKPIQNSQYSFELDGNVFADFVREQMEYYLQARGELPVGVSLSAPEIFSQSVGHGEIWLDQNNLPQRLIVNITFPAGKADQVTASIQTDFSQYNLANLSGVKGWKGNLRLNAIPQNLLNQMWVLLVLIIVAYFFIKWHRTRAVHISIVGVMIISLTITPVLQSHQVKAFNEKYAGEQFNQTINQTEIENNDQESSADPNFEFSQGSSINLSSSVISYDASTSTSSINNGVDICKISGENSDEDLDGLTCVQEVALGTIPTNPDSDYDLIPDLVEVQGFHMGSTNWVTDPLLSDSNNDGISDGMECVERTYKGDWSQYSYSTHTLGSAVCHDTDSDEIPDVFDEDNDGDGVPDNVDLSPGGKLTSTNQFNLVVNNLSGNEPVFVDIQLVPTNPKHLWYALNVLDWPDGDEKGQIQRKTGNNSTYATKYGTSNDDPSSGNGDMRLVPMLEISIPWDPSTFGNLPVKPDVINPITASTPLEDWLDKSKLEVYGVAVKKKDNNGNMVAYVPLNLVNDSMQASRVAFSARIPYFPTSTKWGQAHQMRLVWLIRGLIDYKCDPAQGDPNCQANGWSLDNDQIIQTYYEDFSLTGLVVREDLGLDLVALFENPAVDNNLDLDDQLWVLVNNLDLTFFGARDSDGNNIRDINVAEISRRFNLNSSASDLERWGVQKGMIGAVRYTYDHQDMIASMMAENTEDILNTYFINNSQILAQNPTILFVREETSRTGNLDFGDQSNDNLITVSLDPDSQVMGAIQWRTYQKTNEKWNTADIANYLERMAMNLINDTTNTFFQTQSNSQDDADFRDFKLSIAKSYYLSLVQGYSSILQMGDTLMIHDTTSPIDDNALFTQDLNMGKKYSGHARLVISLAAMAMEMSHEASFIKQITQTVNSTLGVNSEFSFTRYKTAEIVNKIKEGFQKISSSWSDMSKTAKFFSIAGGIAAVAGISVGVYLLVTSDNPSHNIQIVFGCIGVLASGISLVTTVIKIYNAVGNGLVAKMFTAFGEITKAAKMAAVVGAIVAAVITFGLFIYSMISGGVRFGSLEFDAALANTIGTTVALIIMMAIFLIPVVGQIIGAILALIDAIIALVCTIEGKSGDDTWWCNGITGYVAKGISWLIYGANNLIDLSDSNRIKIANYQISQSNDSNGFSANSKINFSMDIDTTIHLEDFPLDWKAAPYFWQWTNANALTSSFNYGLSSDKTDVVASRGTTNWAISDEDFSTTRQGLTNPIPVTFKKAGINVPTELYLNEGYNVPVQECWSIGTFPVCYIRDDSGTNNLDIGSNLIFDIFPATFSGFYTLANKENGFALSWGQENGLSFPRLKDADGDGLKNISDLGSDPNDSEWDSDGDGLSDNFELNKGTDPTLFDSDSDELSDKEEIKLGTNPHLADTDGDGLSDVEEIQGWDFVYGYANGSPLSTHVYSNPLEVNVDGDAYTDAQEKIFGFNPNIPTTKNILTLDDAVYEIDAMGNSTQTDGYLRPGQIVSYQANVSNNLNSHYAQGLLQTSLPVIFSGSILPQTFVLHPQQTTLMQGQVNVNPNVQEGMVTFTQVAEGQITNPAELLTDPRVWLKFDELRNATTFTDNAGVLPAYNATCSGTTCPFAGTTGVTGNAINFINNKNMFLNMSNASSLGLINNDFTISVQVRPTLPTISGVIFATQKINNTSTGLEVGLKDSQPYMAFYNNGTLINKLETTTTLSYSFWYDLTFRYKSLTGEMAIFVNGELEKTMLGVPAFKEDGKTFIGGGVGANKGYFVGWMDNLRIFPQAISDRNISNLAKQPILVLGFDKPTIIDESIHTNDVWCNNCPELRTASLSGKAAFYDKTKQLSAQDPILQVKDTFTQSVWIYPTDTGTASFDTGEQLILGGLRYPFVKLVNKKIKVGWTGSDSSNSFAYTIPNDVVIRSAWNHVVATFNNGLYHVYVNGMEVGNINTGSLRPMSDYNFSIGYGYNGAIDNVTVYSQFLSPDEVNILYLAGQMAMQLRFDDPPGGIQFDGQKSILKNETDVNGQKNAICLSGQCPILGVSGRDERSALFDGVDDLVSLQSSNSELNFNGTTPFSLSAWVNPQGPQKLMNVIGKFNAGVEGSYYLGVKEDDRLFFHRETGGGCDLYSSQPIPRNTNQWSHLVATFDGSMMKIYINGNLSSSLACTKSQYSSMNTPVSVGGYFYKNSPANNFRGRIDNAQIDRRALTSSEVAALFSTTSTTHFNYEDPQGTSTFIDSATGLSVDCLENTCPEAGVKGKVGYAGLFYGSNYLSMSNTSSILSFGGTKPFTLMTWVKPMSGGTLIGKYNEGVSGEYLLRLTEDLKVQFIRSLLPLSQTSTLNLISTISLPTDLWSHVAASYDSTTMRIFINGSLAGFSTSGSISSDTLTNVMIGAHLKSESTTDHFVGSMDETIIYTQALSTYKINDIYRLQSALVEDRFSSYLAVDVTAPLSKLESNNIYRSNQDQQLFISAVDATSGVDKVEWSVNGIWSDALPCRQSSGYCPTFQPSGEGRYVIQTRATDQTGNQESPLDSTTFLVDSHAPQISLNLEEGAIISLHPHNSDPTVLILPLSGTVQDPALITGDPGSGVTWLRVVLLDSTGNPIHDGVEQAQIIENNWSLNYIFHQADPSSDYSVKVWALDNVGNESDPVFQSIQIDTGPAAATLIYPDDNTQIISDVDTQITGSIRDGVSGIPGGVSNLDVEFILADNGSLLFNELPNPNRILHFPFEDTPDINGNLKIQNVADPLNYAGYCSTCPKSGSAGHIGNAFSFSGNKDMVLVPHISNDLSNLPAFSFGGWIKPIAMNAILLENQVIASFNDTTGNSMKMIGIDAKMNTLFYKDTNGYHYANTKIDNNSWHHVMVVVDSQHHGVLYLDGIEAVSFTPDSSTYDVGLFTLGGSKKYPDRSWYTFIFTYGFKPFKGLIDEFQVYREALSAVQVHELFAGSSPQLWLTFDENRILFNGSKINDSSGWESTGIIHTGENDNKSAIPGKVGRYALPLDGLDDYIQFPDPFSGDFTVTTWIKTTDRGFDGQNDITKGIVASRFDGALPNLLPMGLYGNKLSFEISNLSGGSTVLLSNTDINNDQWVHATVTRNAESGLMELYINGNLEATTAGPIWSGRSSENLIIGGFPEIARFFNGKLDDLRIYPRCLSSQEISSLVNNSWNSAILTQPGQTESDWSFNVPYGLEGNYLINLRGEDLLGNFDVNNHWRGLVDTLAPRVTLDRENIEGGVRYTTTAQDYNLVESGFTSPCGDDVITERQSFQSPWYLSQFKINTNDKLYQIKAVCTLSAAPVEEIATACDSNNHCQTISLSPQLDTEEMTTMSLPVEQTFQVSFLEVPSSMDSITETVLRGQVIVPQYLQDLSVTIGETTILHISKAESDAITELLWEVNWTPPGAGNYTLSATATDWAGNALTEIWSDWIVNNVEPASLSIECDEFNHCWTVPFNGLLEDSDSNSTPLPVEQTFEVSFLEVPSAMDSITETVLRGRVIVPQYLQDLSVTIGGTTVLHISKAESDAITGLLWEVNWTPSGPGIYTLSATATDWAGNTLTEIWSDSIVINVEPASLPIECDEFNRCWTVPFTGSLNSQELTATIIPDEQPIQNSFLEIASIVDSINEITLKGQVIVPHYLSQLVINIGDTTILDISREELEATTDMLWEAYWTPSGAGNYQLSATVTDWAGNTITEVFPTPIVVDIDPPSITIEDSFNSQDFLGNGHLILQGTFADDAGVESVKVISINDELSSPLTATLIGDGTPVLTNGVWQAGWLAGWELPKNGKVYHVVIEATDQAGHTTMINQDVEVDVHAPAPLSLSFSNPQSGEIIDPGTTLTTSPATIRLNWEKDPLDDLTINEIVVYWHVSNDQSDEVIERTYHSLSEISELTVNEAAEISVQVVIRDDFDNERWHILGPIYIDGSLTPDYIHMPITIQDDGENFNTTITEKIYLGWQENECTLLGVDNRISRTSIKNTSLSNEQQFYVTWDTVSIRMAWMGANWEQDGDLFIYLDTVDGGSTIAFNPFTDAYSKTIIQFPLDANGVQMAADYVIWVKDSRRAEILAWDSVVDQWLAIDYVPNYIFDPGHNGGSSELLIQLAGFGMVENGSNPLRLVAFASEENSLNIWSSMPPGNSLNSDRVVDILPGDQINQFVMTKNYFWSTLETGMCPNGSLTEEKNQLYTADLDINLSANPVGNAYHLFGDGLFFLMDGMDAFSGYDWESSRKELCEFDPSDPSCTRMELDSRGTAVMGLTPSMQIDQIPAPPGYGLDAGLAANLDLLNQTSSSLPDAYQLHNFMDVDQPPVGDQQLITYSLNYANLGHYEMNDIAIKIITRGPLRLVGGDTVVTGEGESDQLIIELGNLAAGEHKEITFEGRTDFGFDSLNNNGWASLEAIIYTEGDSSIEGTFEWLYVHHEIDQTGPEVGISANPPLLRAGLNTIHGFVFDQSEVPVIKLQVRTIEDVLDFYECDNESSIDGTWSCEINMDQVSDGDIFQIRAMGTDVFGREGVWTDWISFTVDTTPPSLALSDITQRALADGLITPDEIVMSGQITDNRVVDEIEFCNLDEDEENCQRVPVQIDSQTLHQQTFVYEDLPGSPISFGNSACTVGSGLIRSFNVTEDFKIADLKVGLNIAHSYRADVSAWLITPTGKWVNLLYGGNSADNYDVWLDDSAQIPVGEDLHDHVLNRPHFNHELRPRHPLSQLNGEPSKGFWHLLMCDEFTLADGGEYYHGKLELTSSELPGVTQGTWQYSLPGLAFDDYVYHTFNIYGLDSLGNRTTLEEGQALQVDFFADLVAPQIYVTQDPIRKYSPTPEKIIMAGSVTDGEMVRELAVIVQTPMNEHYVEYISVGEDDKWVYSPDPDLMDGTTIQIIAKDRAGNNRSVGLYIVTTAGKYTYFFPLIFK